MFAAITDRARRVMALANDEAKRFNHEYIGTEHLLIGLIAEDEGVGAVVLKGLGAGLPTVRARVEELVRRGPEMVSMGRLPPTPRTKQVIEYAIEVAHSLDHKYMGTEHLLLGLVREEEGVASQVLRDLGLSPGRVRQAVMEILGG